MSISALYILDRNGTIILSRDYRGNKGVEAIEHFIRLLQINENHKNVSPIYENEGIFFAFKQVKDVYFVCILNNNANLTIVFEFLNSLIKILVKYLNDIREESIRDNFVVIYELLDETMDFGYPQTTDSKILMKYIFQENFKLNNALKAIIVPAAVTNAVSWRSDGIKYRKNEVFIDVVESVNLTMNSNKNIVVHEIIGCVKMNIHLSGMPLLRLGLSDKILLALNPYSQTVFEDVKFHQCVQLGKINSEKCIHFIPPDGEFELMSYRANAPIQPLIMVDLNIVKHPRSRIEYTILTWGQYYKSTSTANNVEIFIPVPSFVDSPQINYTIGVAVYVPENNAVIWKIKYLEGEIQHSLKIHFLLPSIEGDEIEIQKPIEVKFIIPYLTVTGLQIRFIKITEKSNYKSLSWVKYTTQSGNYLLRP